MSVHEMLYVELLPGKEEEFMRRLETAATRAPTPGHENVWRARESGIHFYAGINDGHGYAMSYNYAWIPFSVIRAIVLPGRIFQLPVFCHMTYTIEQDLLRDGNWLRWVVMCLQETRRQVKLNAEYRKRQERAKGQVCDEDGNPVAPDCPRCHVRMRWINDECVDAACPKCDAYWNAGVFYDEPQCPEHHVAFVRPYPASGVLQCPKCGLYWTNGGFDRGSPLPNTREKPRLVGKLMRWIDRDARTGDCRYADAPIAQNWHEHRIGRLVLFETRSIWNTDYQEDDLELYVLGKRVVSYSADDEWRKAAAAQQSDDEGDVPF